MAVTNEKSAQIVKYEDPRKGAPDVWDWHGRMRPQHFDFQQGAAEGDPNSTQELVILPAGSYRIFLHASRIWNSAFGAGALLSIGHRGYTAKDGTVVPEDLAAFASGVNVAAAGDFSPTGVVGEDESVAIQAREPLVIVAQVTGAAIPAGAELKGEFFYVGD